MSSGACLGCVFYSVFFLWENEIANCPCFHFGKEMKISRIEKAQSPLLLMHDTMACPAMATFLTQEIMQPTRSMIIHTQINNEQSSYSTIFL
jgi:hypothetical protein